MISSSNLYYETVTNKNSISEQERIQLIALKKAILEALKTWNKESPFDEYLSSLPLQDKSHLLAALVQNNTIEIAKYLNEPIKKIYPELEINPNILNHLTRVTASDRENSWLSKPVQKIIKAMLVNNEIINVLLVQDAMQLIPDTDFTIKSKYQIASGILPEISNLIDALAYKPPLVLFKENKYSGNISEKEYNSIIENKSLDISEFIVASLGVLQNSMADDAEALKDLDQIVKLYDKLSYSLAINEIKFFCEKYPINTDLKNNILIRSAECGKPNINENLVRRFYENRIAQLNMYNIDLTKANKVSIALTGVGASQLSEISHIPSAAMMKRKAQYFTRYEELTKQSTRHTTRDRTKKEGMFSMRANLKESKGNNIWSNNPGIMISNQPNFSDEITDISLINKVPDRNIAVGPKDPLDTRYLSAYAGSTSGHAFYIVALVEDYMKNNTTDPDLAIDINSYISACIFSNVQSGYHTYLEMVDVFNEPHIKKIFDHYNVKLDLNSKSEVIVQAMKDTQEYAKAIGLKKSLANELKSLQKPIADAQLQINAIAHKTMVEQIATIKDILSDYQKNQGLLKNVFSSKYKICTLASNALSSLEKKLHDPNIDLAEIDSACRRTIRVLEIQNLISDKTGGKLGNAIIAITHLMQANKEYIDNLQKKHNNNTLVKQLPSHGNPPTIHTHRKH